jgi:drug/metabolite transporter (DMT)-like permease
MNFIGFLGIPAISRWVRTFRGSQGKNDGEQSRLDSAEEQEASEIFTSSAASSKLSLWFLSSFPRLVFLYGLYVVANISYVIALDGLTAALASAIFCAAPALVCCMSWWILECKFCILEAAAVAVAILGILLTTQPWKKSSGRERAYAAVAALAPVAAALYKVMFAKYFRNAGWISVGGVLSQLCVLNLIIGTPLLACVVAAGFEEFPSAVPWGLVLGSSLVAMVFNFLVNYGVSVTIPILISMGSLLATALNVIVALVENESLPDVSQSVGMCLLGLSLVALLFVVLRR